MKKLGFILILTAILVYMGNNIYTKQMQREQNTGNKVKVLLVYNRNQQSDILKAYESVLEEEGVPFELIKNQELILLSPKKTAQNIPAVIFPENINKFIENGTGSWLSNYVKSGGKAALVYDVNTKKRDGTYKISSTYLDRLIGINMAFYAKDKHKDKSLSYGKVHFKNMKSAQYFEIPAGKLDGDLYVVGYQYGRLTYPVISVNTLATAKGQTLYASDEKGRPVIVKTQVGKGAFLYVNLPLGYLKGRSDDMMLRNIMKTFLLKISQVPHIVSAPNAKGTLVLNWHIDSQVEHTILPWNIEHNNIRKDLNQSFHITAGPFRDKPNDKLGFDVAGKKGRELVKKLMKYGKIGSHGGWAHNWFAKNIESGKFGKADIKKYIKMNNEALEKITGYKITEYSAPVGVFPPIENVEVLKELGMNTYYYTGDTGSAPNRTFFNGKMLSDTIITFPIMSFGKSASMKEFTDNNISKETVSKYYKEFIDYLVENRIVRLYYLHSYDIHDYDYKKEWKEFMDGVEKNVHTGSLQTRTLTDIRAFLLRLIHTESQYKISDKGLEMSFSNPSSLNELVVAMPKKIGDKYIKAAKSYEQDEDYYYIPLQKNKKKITQLLNFK